MPGTPAPDTPHDQWLALLERAAFLTAARQLTPRQHRRLIRYARACLKPRRWWFILPPPPVHVIGR